MEFKIIEGDLLDMAMDAKFDLIVHGCNCRCNMGSGIAGTISQRFPDAARVDRLTVDGDYNKMGNFTYASVQTEHAGKKFNLINLYTQYNPGSASPGCSIPLDYEALTLGLRKIAKRWPKASIGLPWIGCGLARGNKDKVQKIIERELSEMNVTIVEFKIQ